MSKKIVSDRNHHPVVIDTGIKGTPAIEADVSREDVAAADGASIEGLLAASDKNQAIQTMARGARKIVQQMYSSGELDGVFGVGGVQGTVISTTAMQGLPIGIPKFVLSTVANGQATFGPFIGTRDIAIMHSVGDILGLNSLTPSDARARCRSDHRYG